MGDGRRGLKSGSEQSAEGDQSLEQQFENLCPYYMLYGMTYDEFWHGDPMMAPAYRKLYELRVKESDEQMHLNGVYTRYAFHADGKKHKYPKNPLGATIQSRDLLNDMPESIGDDAPAAPKMDASEKLAQMKFARMADGFNRDLASRKERYAKAQPETTQAGNINASEDGDENPT